MAYVAVKGGEAAIDAAHAWRAALGRGDPALARVEVAQLVQQLGRAVDRVMSEGSLYDPELAALAIRQAQGDLIEAAFLLRAFRTTLPRFAASRPVDTAAMRPLRRVSATFKDLPGGQVLGPTADYTHRLLEFTPDDAPVAGLAEAASGPAPRVAAVLGGEGLLEPNAGADAEADGSRATSPARRWRSLPRARRGSRHSRAATRASCSASATRPSAATATPTRSWPSCAWAGWRWRSTCRNSALRSRSARSR